MNAFAGEVVSRPLDVLGRHANAAAAANIGLPVKAAGSGHAHAAAGDAQVHGHVQAVAAVLIERIPAGNAKVCRAVLHVRRHIGCTKHHDAEILPIRSDHELARVFRIFQRTNAGGGQKRQHLLKDSSFR